jgi:hypothetical protein
MVMDPATTGIVDVEFELFWREVGQAVHQLELAPEIESATIEIERGNRGAIIRLYKGKVAVMFHDVQPKQPALLVP